MAKNDQQVLVIGEALTDVVIPHDSDPKEATSVPGGSSANVALALGRLGLPVSLATWIADDEDGKVITEHLTKSGVKLTPGSFGAKKTSRAIAHLNESGDAKYDFEFEWAPDPIKVTANDLLVHTGSIAAVVQADQNAALQALRAARGTAVRSYDPNVRTAVIGDPEQARATVNALVAQSDLVKASAEDLEWLYPGMAAETIAEQLISRFHVSMFVITKGADGATAWTRGGATASITCPKVDVVDTIAAGDTFMAGLIDALWTKNLVGADGPAALAALDQDTLAEILKNANDLSQIVIQREGANPPWAEEIGR